MFYYFFFWKCFTVAAFSVLISFVILWFVFLVKGGQVAPRSVFLLFFLLLQSVSWRSLTWFWVRFRKVVFLSSLLLHWPPFRQCLNIDPSAQSGTKAQATLAEQRPTSNSDFRRQILIFNADFRKQTSTFKLRFWKTNFHFPKHTRIFIFSHFLLESNAINSISISYFKLTKITSRPWDKGGGGGGVEGQSQKKYFLPFGLLFGLKIRRGLPLGPLQWIPHCVVTSRHSDVLSIQFGDNHVVWSEANY